MKFWNWVTNQAGVRSLYLDGYIAQDSWYDDDVTPKQFKQDLDECSGDITVWINSPGGDVFAASQIYTMLKEYKGAVTVKIDGIAASAASVIAMAGDMIYMSPTANMMIHNPATIAWGEKSDFEKAIGVLDSVKESIMNAYELKTKLSRAKLSQMMDAETWMSASKAVDLGFADKVLYAEGEDDTIRNSTGFMFDQLTVTNVLINKLPRRESAQPAEPQHKENGTPIADLEKRLALLKS